MLTMVYRYNQLVYS